MLLTGGTLVQAQNVLRNRTLRVLVGVAALGAGALVAVGGNADAAGGTNLLPNPGFEGTLTGALTGWAGTSAAGVELVNGGAAGGTYSAKVSFTGTTTGAYAIYTTAKPAKSLPKGEVFKANGKLRVPLLTGKPICLQLLEQNATSTVQTVSKCVTASSTGWVAFPEASLTVQQNGTGLKMQVRQASGAAGHVFQVDDLSLVDPDLTKPTTPTALKAVPTATNKVTLSWTASKDVAGGAVGYRIYRNHRTSPVATVRGATSWVDTTVSDGQWYSYQIAAFDFAGNVSSNTTDVKAITPWAGPAAYQSYWNMDETTGTTMADSTGSSPGKLTSVSLGHAGWRGKAYLFNGTSSQVVVSNDAPLNPGARRFKMYTRIKTTTLPAVPDYDLIRKGQAPNAEYKMEIQPNGQASCTFDGTLGHATVQNGPKLNNGAWHTIECAKDATTVTLTIDGVSWTKTVTIGDISNTSDVVIGAYPGFDFYQGYLDATSIRIG